MDSVRSARSRLARYPSLVAQCGKEATAYARCVAGAMAEVRRDQCKEEFEAFSLCVRRAAAKGTK